MSLLHQPRDVWCIECACRSRRKLSRQAQDIYQFLSAGLTATPADSWSELHVHCKVAGFDDAKKRQKCWGFCAALVGTERRVRGSGTTRQLTQAQPRRTSCSYQVGTGLLRFLLKAGLHGCFRHGNYSGIRSDTSLAQTLTLPQVHPPFPDAMNNNRVHQGLRAKLWHRH